MLTEDFVCCFSGKMQETFRDDAINTRDGENCDYISSQKEKQITIKNVSDLSDLRILYRICSLSNMLYMLYFQHLLHLYKNISI